MANKTTKEAAEMTADRLCNIIAWISIIIIFGSIVGWVLAQ